MTYTIDRSAPLLPLDEFRRLMGFNPFHFWQLANDLTPIRAACNPLVMEYAWQHTDAVGRSEIREAIMRAEERIKSLLDYAPAPRAEQDEIAFPQYYDPRQSYLSSSDAKGRWLAFNLNSYRVRQIGALTVESIGDAAPVITDADGDGIDDTFTLSIATTVTDVTQVAVYFASSERLDSAGLVERWRIQPVSVSIAGGIATITGRLWTIVKPIKYEGMGTNALDPDTAANFPSALTVARRYIDTTNQGSFIWESTPGANCDLNTDPSAIASSTARYVVRNSDVGIIAGEAAAYDADALEWVSTAWPVSYAPERAIVNYIAGEQDTASGQMSERFKLIVARFAAAELARPLCGCEEASAAVSYWQFDLAQSSGAQNGESYQMPFASLDNPFGTRRGHVYAWQELKALSQSARLSRASTI